MSYNLIAEGTDVNEIGNYEPMLAEGDYGQVIAYTESPPPPGAIAQLEADLRSTGITLTAPVTYSEAIGAVVISFRKQMSPLGYIGWGLGGLVLFGVAVFAWQIIQSMGTNPTLGIWIVVGIVAFILFIKSQEGKATMRTLTSGAAYAGKAAVDVWAERATQTYPKSDRTAATTTSRERSSFSRSTGRASAMAGGGTDYSSYPTSGSEQMTDDNDGADR